MSKMETEAQIKSAMRALPTGHMTADEVEAVEAIMRAAYGRIDDAVVAKRAEWDALCAKNGAGVYREVSSYTGTVEREIPVAVLRCTKSLIIVVKEPMGLSDGDELRFSAVSGRPKWKSSMFTGPRREMVLHSASDRVKAVVAATADHKDAKWNTAWRERVARLPAPNG